MACSRTAREYPRQFIATALPLGDPQWLVPGPLIQLVERAPVGGSGEEVIRLKLLAPEEAGQLCASLLLALESLAAFAPQNREAACA